MSEEVKEYLECIQNMLSKPTTFKDKSAFMDLSLTIDLFKCACKDAFTEAPKTPYEKVFAFIRERGYSYTVQTVVDEYKHKYGKYYVSHTMKDCCQNLKEELDALIAEGY